MQSGSSSGSSRSAATSVASATHLRDYWVVVLKRVPWVLLVLVVSTAITFWITRRQQKLYRATATIEMLPLRRVAAIDNFFAPTILQDNAYLQTQLKKLEMSETLRKAADSQNLVNAPEFQGKTLDDIVRHYRGRVDARQRRGEYLVDVTVIGPSHSELDNVANSLVEHFKKMQRDESEELRASRERQLQGEETYLTSQIRVARVDKRTELETGGFTEATFEAEYLAMVQDRQDFQTEKNRIEILLSSETPTYDLFRAVLDDPENRSIDEILNHPRVTADLSVQEKTAALRLLRGTRTQLLAQGFGEKHEEVKKLDTAIAQLEKEYKDVARIFIENFIILVEERRAALPRLVAQIEEHSRRIEEAARIKAFVDEKTAEIAGLMEDKRAVMSEQEAIKGHGTSVNEAVRIIGLARQPNINNPHSPNEMLNYTLGAIVGLLAGVGLAFLLDYMDDTIRTKDELAKITEVPLLGVVPRMEGKKKLVAERDLFAFRQPKSTVAEAYRGVRTALTLRSHGSRHRVLLLTSAGPREGKTTTVINVATVLAYASTRTLVIDCDLRKPRVHKSFGVDNASGLTNLIVSDGDPREFCQTTEVPGVDVLTSGPIPPNPSELLGSERMEKILTRLREHYDHIVLDTPPIGAVTDAAVLGTIVDGVILVVHAGKTRRGVVSRGLEQLRYISAPIEGVILNNLRMRGRYYPGYYNYYYYYSYYGAGGERVREASKSTATKAKS